MTEIRLITTLLTLMAFRHPLFFLKTVHVLLLFVTGFE